MAEFNEKGIGALQNLMEEDVDHLLDRLRALQEYSKEYDSFSGKAEDMPGSVRFIMRTESIGE